jgi:hypothetical protein
MTMTAQILAAIRNGAETSGEIAQAVASRRGTISVALCRLADIGSVERAGSLCRGGLGRPYVRWRLRFPSPIAVAAVQNAPVACPRNLDC